MASTLSLMKGAPPRDERPEYLTRAAVARMLGVSPNTVTRWAREGRLPCQVTLGGHHRFERELVEQLLQTLTRSGRQGD
jgi:excisionase family DNA binding protein